MKFFYYNVTEDLFAPGLMFLVYFTAIAALCLLVAINFKFRNNRSSTDIINSKIKPFLYKIPMHIEHSVKYVDFVEYESYKKLIYRVDEIEDMKKNNPNRVPFYTREGYTQSRNVDGKLEMNKKVQEQIISAGIGQTGQSRAVNENLWRGFNKSVADSMGGTNAGAGQEGFEIQSFKNDLGNKSNKGSRFEGMKRKKLE